MAYARLITRDDAGLHPNLRGFLGDWISDLYSESQANPIVQQDNFPTLPGADFQNPSTPTDFLALAITSSKYPRFNGRDYLNPSWIDRALQSVEQGFIDPGWFSPNCVTSAAPSVNLFSTASGLALGTTSATTGILGAAGVIGAGTGALLGVATMGAGLIVSVIGMIFAHHAAAVKEEQQLGCTALNAAKNALQLIRQAVQNGQATPADAMNSLDALFNQYSQYVAPSFGTDPYCNANCEFQAIMEAVINYQKFQLSQLAAQQSALSQEAINSTTDSPTSTPNVVTPANPAGVSPSEFRGGYIAPSPLSNIPGWAWILGGLAFAWAVL